MCGQSSYYGGGAIPVQPRYVQWGGGCGTPKNFGKIIATGRLIREDNGVETEVTIVEPFISDNAREQLNGLSDRLWWDGEREVSVTLNGLVHGVRVFQGPPTDHNLISEVEYNERVEALQPQDEDYGDDEDNDEDDE